jgi:dienelactone hydrolase
MAFARTEGFGALAERGVAAANELSPDVVYAGFSFGVMVAQQLAQTRPGRAGPCSCTPASRSRSSVDAWPEERPGAGARQGRRSVLRRGPRGGQALVDSTDRAELFLYPGEEHLFADSSLPAYDAAAAALLTERVLAFLDAVE